MSTKKLLLGLLIAAGTVMTPVVSQARTDINLGFTFGQPAAPVTAFPAAHRDFAPGHSSWDGYREGRVEGRSFARRPGFAWVPGHWEGRGRHRHFVQGHWARDHSFDRRFY